MNEIIKAAQTFSCKIFDRQFSTFSKHYLIDFLIGNVQL